MMNQSSYFSLEKNIYVIIASTKIYITILVRTHTHTPIQEKRKLKPIKVIIKISFKKI